MIYINHLNSYFIVMLSLLTKARTLFLVRNLRILTTSLLYATVIGAFRLSATVEDTLKMVMWLVTFTMQYHDSVVH